MNPCNWQDAPVSSSKTNIHKYIHTHFTHLAVLRRTFDDVDTMAEIIKKKDWSKFGNQRTSGKIKLRKKKRQHSMYLGFKSGRSAAKKIQPYDRA